jgi:hypothetical protein
MSRHERAIWIAVYAIAALMIPLATRAQEELPADIEEVNGVPTNMIMWSALVGFFLPLAIEVPKRQRWPSWAKGLFAFACCLLAAAGTAFFSGTLQNFRDIATAALFVTFTALGSYRLLWKPSGIANGINDTTNPTPPPPPVYPA